MEIIATEMNEFSEKINNVIKNQCSISVFKWLVFLFILIWFLKCALYYEIGKNVCLDNSGTPCFLLWDLSNLHPIPGKCVKWSHFLKESSKKMLSFLKKLLRQNKIAKIFMWKSDFMSILLHFSSFYSWNCF